MFSISVIYILHLSCLKIRVLNFNIWSNSLINRLTKLGKKNNKSKKKKYFFYSLADIIHFLISERETACAASLLRICPVGASTQRRGMPVTFIFV